MNELLNKFEKAIDILMKKQELEWCEFCEEWKEVGHRKKVHFRLNN